MNKEIKDIMIFVKTSVNGDGLPQGIPSRQDNYKSRGTKISQRIVWISVFYFFLVGMIMGVTDSSHAMSLNDIMA
jgi:hypothetical protein